MARSLPPAAVEAAPGEGTEVASGSLDEVVGADAKPVSLRASEAISDEHPVEVSFDLAKDSEQAPQLGGMVINVPASGDHAPEAGRLLVELTDGTVREIGISRAEARAAFFRSSAPTASPKRRAARTSPRCPRWSSSTTWRSASPNPS